jgi:hypothetical protein
MAKPTPSGKPVKGPKPPAPPKPPNFQRSVAVRASQPKPKQPIMQKVPPKTSQKPPVPNTGKTKIAS